MAALAVPAGSESLDVAFAALGHGLGIGYRGTAPLPQWPAELRELPEQALPEVADTIRAELIDSVTRTGGHFAGNLGAVELTVALHYVFDTPHDQVVWDTGHQAYAHKMLTGRWERLESIRRLGGLSGFPRRAESVYDCFGVGHAGTAAGAALGMAVGSQARRCASKTVAVVGDGGLTAGMTFEALNHAGSAGADLLLIVNHNGMSISPSVGALGEHLEALGEMPYQPELKGGLPPRQCASVFENLGFASFGPVDGHDVIGLARTLRRLKAMGGPRVLHVVTVKGKGYGPAEQDPTRFHAISPKSPMRSGAAPDPSFSDVFGEWLMERAREDERLVCITPAMIDGSGLVPFSRAFPNRLHDVAIAEQHAVTFAAGLATTGQRPVVAIYSSFLQRAFDQVVHDVALQGLPVLFAIDRAGIVGPDGATHAGCLDLSFLRCVPNLVIAAPADGPELRSALDCARAHEGPAAVRYPRGSALPVRAPGTQHLSDPSPSEPWSLGRGRVVRRGRRVALLSFGALLGSVLEAAEALDATVADLRWIKPLDEALVARLASRHELLVSVEDNALCGGAGSAVGELLLRKGLGVGLLSLGLPDRFLEHGTRAEILAQCGLDGPGIERAVLRRLAHGRRCASLAWR
ncbi:MAG: 1-deoxy-D-xylulose-5-phosphate synthase [Bdellovibrio bacteriovorus]